MNHQRFQSLALSESASRHQLAQGWVLGVACILMLRYFVTRQKPIGSCECSKHHAQQHRVNLRTSRNICWFYVVSLRWWGTKTNIATLLTRRNDAYLLMISMPLDLYIWGHSHLSYWTQFSLDWHEQSRNAVRHEWQSSSKTSFSLNQVVGQNRHQQSLGSHAWTFCRLSGGAEKIRKELPESLRGRPIAFRTLGSWLCEYSVVK